MCSHAPPSNLSNCQLVGSLISSLPSPVLPDPHTHTLTWLQTFCNFSSSDVSHFHFNLFLGWHLWGGICEFISTIPQAWHSTSPAMRYPKAQEALIPECALGGGGMESEWVLGVGAVFCKMTWSLAWLGSRRHSQSKNSLKTHAAMEKSSRAEGARLLAPHWLTLLLTFLVLHVLINNLGTDTNLPGVIRNLK